MIRESENDIRMTETHAWHVRDDSERRNSIPVRDIG